MQREKHDVMGEERRINTQLEPCTTLFLNALPVTRQKALLPNGQGFHSNRSASCLWKFTAEGSDWFRETREASYVSPICHELYW